MVSLGSLKISFRFVATVLFFFISRSPFHCALSASIVGSVPHPVGDRPSHPIWETVPVQPVDATPCSLFMRQYFQNELILWGCTPLDLNRDAFSLNQL